MKTLVKLILAYKVKLEDPNYVIWCNKKNNKNIFHSYDSDTILKNFLSEVTGYAANDLPWEIKDPKGMKIQYSLSNDKYDIMLCNRRVTFSHEKNFRTVKHSEKKKFMFIPYINEWDERIETEESKKQPDILVAFGYSLGTGDSSYRYEKTVYAITYENIIFEIDKDTYKELEMFTLKSIEDRSTNKIIEII